MPTILTAGAAILSTRCSNPTEHTWCSQINQSEPRLLLVQRGATAPTFPEHWGFPAGIVDQDETLAEATARETWEEVGIRFKAEDLFFQSSWENRQLSYFTGGWRAPKQLVLQADELSGYGWFSFESALKLPLAFRYAEAIKTLAEQY
jgi:8-oxo-dGTP pyrophosphatase MutT (NUDIX family)